MSVYSFEDEFNTDFADSFGYETPEFVVKHSDLTGKQHYGGANEFEHKFGERLLYPAKIPQPLSRIEPDVKFEGIGDRLKYYFSENAPKIDNFVTIPNWSVVRNKVVGDGSGRGLVIRIVIILYIILFVMGLFIMKDLNEIRTDLKILNAKVK